MITNLSINNFTLIDSLDIDFQRGFSVITGETGAGKSIILGALSMLLGHRADSKSVKAGTQRCVIEAHFNITGYGLEPFFERNDLDYDSTDCILRRELTAAGKSRAFINDTPVSLAVLRELSEGLVDIHSQHQNLLLRDADFQLSVVDIIAKNDKEQAAYSKAFKAYTEAKKKLAEMQKQMDEGREQEDFMRFQLQELDEADLSDANEQEELEKLSDSMEHSEEIKSALYSATDALNGDVAGAIQQLRVASNAINTISSIFPSVQEVAERLDSGYIELKDISGELSALLDHVDFDPREQERINDRLDLLYTLEKKHHCNDIQSLTALRDNLRERLSLIDNSDEAVMEQEKIVQETKEKAEKCAAALTSTRQKAAKTVEAEMHKRLVPLGIPKVQFIIDIKETELTHSGSNSVTFLFSANTSTAVQPVSQVASGGEIARVMLSLKAMISYAVSLPTIIFDEIDTGVSGKIAEAMAHIMKEMGDCGRQVISITHLPQIAALGSEHYRVQKAETEEGTRTRMTHLTHDERIQEIAQMLSGSSVSEAAILQARELLG
ncbi:DNA repair protein RecN [Prevotella sp. PINT]|jgi:DNA repair protein RecN|uniref:DNA repair protein RecN n=1 Tax=Palleniella intestinalis TaxID=2736291 RepID=UPI001554BE15|nr:DNA repair protein RecN [Palleniella intestinalis]NPD80816.1 DNA repair protein RecN [Palleniella intestinalis]